MVFQSTPPARGATEKTQAAPGPTCVSIHAPRAGGDVGAVTHVPPVNAFQSTPPARGATTAVAASYANNRVSIHAPRAGGDRQRFARASRCDCFNPRPPRGGRHPLWAVPLRMW